ncbi:MAG: N-6 DNA methylase, partial [Asgard group archaeon]|nr:N-6 DNA methylase [Asgard group archaeon]
MDLDIKIEGDRIFSPLKQKWLKSTPEEAVRQKYIQRLVNHYGFSPNQMEQEVTVSNTSRGKGGARADIIVYENNENKRNRKNAKIIVECKADNITIQREDYFQGANYAAMAGADFFVTTNIKETKVFKVIKGEIPKSLEEILDIPDAESLLNEKEVKKLLTQTKSFTRDEFSKLLFKCHNIIRNNDKLSPEAAFDEISKILFIKIRYERSNEKGQLFSLKQFKNDKEAYNRYKSTGSRPFYQQLFENTKEDFTNDDLFADNEIIRIRENSFESIVEELQRYNLSTTSDDIKGIAFEQFLGKTFRGELGQFFTPRTVVDFMVEILDPEEGELICDPCCGSGGFLIKAFEYIRQKLEQSIIKEKERIQKEYFDSKYEKLPLQERKKVDEMVNKLFNKLNLELDISNSSSRLWKISHENIYGIDANPRMARTAKMNMIMHGDGHGGVHHHDGFLNVNGIFENRFDAVITNPPFGSRVDKSILISESDKFSDDKRKKQYRDKFGGDYD